MANTIIKNKLKSIKNIMLSKILQILILLNNLLTSRINLKNFKAMISKMSKEILKII